MADAEHATGVDGASSQDALLQPALPTLTVAPTFDGQPVEAQPIVYQRDEDFLSADMQDAITVLGSALGPLLVLALVVSHARRLARRATAPTSTEPQSPSQQPTV